jgi:hypothetical protein
MLRQIADHVIAKRNFVRIPVDPLWAHALYCMITFDVRILRYVAIAGDFDVFLAESTSISPRGA